MERNVLLYIYGDTFYILVRHGIRIMRHYREDGLGGDHAETRARAAAKALEFALEYKVDLREVQEKLAAID